MRLAVDDLIISHQHSVIHRRGNLAYAAARLTGGRNTFSASGNENSDANTAAADNASTLERSEKSAEEYSGESLNRTQTDGDTQKTYILVKAADGSQKPLIVTKTEPEIRGVVVVSRGGGDPKMREKIVEAVKTALDLSSTQVCVVGYSEYTYGNE